MLVGDVISLDWAAVNEAQEGIRAAMADGNRLIEVEIPTTNKFKDKALNQIYQANTEVPRSGFIIGSEHKQQNHCQHIFYTVKGIYC
jgi:hypothetical protein